ncbi:uncharacterized protein LOC125027582 [Penaeus chinensis]|uniref:uncharacterized protein LOC125027582 n=1 Tax=Penaeus chinensis TaxID=139456 RepID=UPI001FB73FC8|nr:uncharacterized protein LOC125027582 [Penaeus chinensis]XP_047472641.1 uncharacterized protein LOC125027582 [Penaeus chinensis]XP_047472642.1 uncharacterized protein LOC125027582 [Penaeus chinensis]
MTGSAARGGQEDKAAGRLLRPASEVESFFETFQTQGTFLTAYWITLRTAEPLQEASVGLALRHLFRKVPPLRTCFRKRGDCMWLCEMDEEAVDFQVEEEADPKRVMEDLMSQSYASHEGPLWRARLVRGAAGEDCPLEEVRASFPHTSHLVLGNHHGIADGTSNARTYNLLLRILDDVIAGRPIDDQEQLGEMVVQEEFKAMVSAKLRELQKDPENLQRLVEEKKKVMTSVPLLLQCYPSVQGTERKTELIFEELDEDTTHRFFHRCKSEGVSVGSAFTALINGATIDLAKKAGRTDQTFTLNESHALDVRRFLSGDASRHLGVHITVLHNAVEAPAAWRESFWDYARTLHRSLHTNLSQDGHLLESCIREASVSTDDVGKATSLFPPPYEDSVCTNMRNLDAVCSDVAGEHVQATRILRGASNYTSAHFFHTFRRRFLYSLCSSAHILPRDAAKALTRAIFDNLRSLV